MPPTAATAAVNLVATGDDAIVAKFNKIEKATGGIGRQFGSASRTASNFGASMAQAGTLGVTSLAGIAQQASEVAFGFGPAGPIIGALATTGIAIGALFFKAKKEVEEYNQSLRRLLFDSNFAAAQSQYRDLTFKIQEAQRQIADADSKMHERTNAFAAIGILHQRSSAEKELNKLTGERAKLLPVLKKLAIDVGDSQRVQLEYQREQTALAKAEAAAKTNATASEAARVALAKASEGITLGGPSVDFVDITGTNAPTVRIKVLPYLDSNDPRTGDALKTIEEQMAEMLAQRTNGVDMEFAEFGTNIVASMANGIGQAAGGGFKGVGGIILSGLGSIFKQMGSALIAYGATMLKLLPALSNPLTSGPAALIAGAALVAVGTALSGAAMGTGGGGAGGGFSSGVGAVTAPAQITNITLASGSSTQAAGKLSPQQPIGPNYFFGPNDPVVQRQLVETMENARRRGL